MRFPIYSIRTGVLAHLALLIMAAMLLINVVMLKFEERNLIRARLHTGRLTIRTLEQKIGYKMVREHQAWADLSKDTALKKEINRILRLSGFSDVLMVDRQGIKTYMIPLDGKTTGRTLQSAREALSTGQEIYYFDGTTWGVIWLAHRRLSLSAPMFASGDLIGALTISSDLFPMYQSLRKSEMIILGYIFLNTVVLVLVGLYILSRIVVKPIDKLLKITETFKEGESIPPFENASQNEIGELSRSLNMMLTRLETNKKELKAHIASLESANLEIKKAQEEIIKSEKLASVGRLAAGLAHEIGNPIGIILGYIDLLKRGKLDSDESTDALDRIESEITRINHIIRQLLDFSRPASGEKEKSRVHTLLTDTLDMLDPQPMMSHISVEKKFEASQDAVWVDPNQLKQVFLNIIMNAADAMAQEDDDEQTRPDRILTIQTKNTGKNIHLDFKDSGPGIPEQELPHIFDPFFTTKEPGKGTGLGLSVAYRIIDELGGSIEAKSAPGDGTTITMAIPLYGKINESSHSEGVA